MSEPGGIPSSGHIPCPRCGQPVLPEAPLCPNCGTQLSRGRQRSGIPSGVWTLLGGLGICVLSAAGFFVSCLGAMGGGSSGAKTAGTWMGIAGFALLAGLVVMVVGFVMTLVQTLRRR